MGRSIDRTIFIHRETSIHPAVGDVRAHSRVHQQSADNGWHLWHESRDWNTSLVHSIEITGIGLNNFANCNFPVLSLVEWDDGGNVPDGPNSGLLEDWVEHEL